MSISDLNNAIKGYNPEQSNEEIKSNGGNGVYKSGVHTAVSAEIVLFESVYEGQATTKANIIITTDTGAILIDDLKATPNSNQTASKTNLLSYMHYIAVVTDKVADLSTALSQFGTLPRVKYTDAFKKEYDAVSIRVFANTKFKFMTYSEVSGDANGIYTKQKVVLNQLFRFADNASLGEIKDNKTEVGGSYIYWTTDPITCAAKTQVQYKKNRHEADAAVLEVIADYLKEAKVMSKDQREKIQKHWNADYAKTVLSGRLSPVTSIDTSSIDVEDDDASEPSFG